jgi:hypothetical protein
MAFPIHSLERPGQHVPRIPAAPAVNPATTQTKPAQSTETAPSFSAVFAQIAAAAAAAGTTVASIVAPAGSNAPPTPVPLRAAVTTADAPSTDGPAGPLFGANPWLADPTGNGPDGNVTHYNPVYFATQQTAQTVAGMLGGQVVQSVQITTAPGSPFQQNQPNYMVQLPNGGLVNPGFIADIYTHGWSQSFIDKNVANEVAGAQPTLST